MKRTLLILATLALFLTVACATTSAPTTAGVVTAVDGSSITVAANGASPTTYTFTRSTNVYSPDGVLTTKSYLSNGQRVQVWANGEKAVRINIAP